MTATAEFYKAAFSSQTGKWDTPTSLTLDLATVFNWDVDVCAERDNVCVNYFTPEIDGLSQHWRGLCWMNPPYGREIGQWLKHALFQVEAYKGFCNTRVVCLIPARTDTRWWHNCVKAASMIVLIKGRLKFGGAKNSAPFPSAFAVFGQLTEPQNHKLASYGQWIQSWK